MTTVVDAKTTTKQKTPDEKTREEIDRAHRERDDAVQAEYRGLMDIVWAHHHAASAAILAARHAAGMTDDMRRDLLQQAVKSLGAARGWLDQAMYQIDGNEPPF